VVNFNEYALNEHTMLEVSQVITHPDYNWGPQSDPHDLGIPSGEAPSSRRADQPANPYFLDYLRDTGQLRDGAEEADFTVVLRRAGAGVRL
jgi:hypothetical protein